ncbi:MAG: hypothetical protein Q7S53_02410 [bacterium]|nr:hypothetical protein [bacterium]
MCHHKGDHEPQQIKKGIHMSLLDEYENRYETPRLDIAKNILFTIADDIFGRSGFD